MSTPINYGEVLRLEAIGNSLVRLVETFKEVSAGYSDMSNRADMAKMELNAMRKENEDLTEKIFLLEKQLSYKRIIAEDTDTVRELSSLREQLGDAKADLTTHIELGKEFLAERNAARAEVQQLRAIIQAHRKCNGHKDRCQSDCPFYGQSCEVCLAVPPDPTEEEERKEKGLQ